MKKKLTVLLCLVLSLLLLTGCASQDIAKAKTAYANGDYQTVVDLLENLKSSKPEVAELLNNAKIHLAFDEGDYQKVVDLIGSEEGLAEDIASLLEQAQTALAEEAAAEEARLAEEAAAEEARLAAEAKLTEIQEAFDVKDYEKVLELASDADAENEDIAALLEQAKTALAEEAAAEEARLAEEAAAAEEARLAEEAKQAEEAAAQEAKLAEEAAAAEEARLAEEAKQAEEAAAQEAKFAEEAAAAEEAKLAEEARIAAEARLAEVQEAFDAKDYQSVIDLIGDDTVEDEALAAMLASAQTALAEEAAAEEARLAAEAKLTEIKEAYDAQDYAKVVELVSGTDLDIAGEEVDAMVATAQTEINKAAKLTELKEAYDAQDYAKVVELVSGTDLDIAGDEVDAMVATAQTELDKAAKLAEIKEAYDAQDYAKVVELVSGTDLDIAGEEVDAMVATAQTELDKAAKLAEIKEAFDAQDYTKVVELVSGTDLDISGEEVDAMLHEASVQLAYHDGNYAEVVSLLADTDDKASNEMYMDSIRQVAKDAILATGDDRYVQLPEDGDYLPEFKTKYVDHLIYDGWVFNIFADLDDALENQKNCGPCIPVERVPALRTGRQNMPWCYEGSKVTVVAEENDMSFVLYPSFDYRERAGWVQTRFLVDEFPGDLQTIGEASSVNTQTVSDIAQAWSRQGFLTSLQSYTTLAEPVENCVGFTLDYQIISENTDKWACIFGPRTVYINNGSEWIKVGTFDYPTQGTVKVTVNLEEPTDITAIGTIPEVGMPNTATFRQLATDFRVAD